MTDIVRWAIGNPIEAFTLVAAILFLGAGLLATLLWWKDDR